MSVQFPEGTTFHDYSYDPQKRMRYFGCKIPEFPMMDLSISDMEFLMKRLSKDDILKKFWDMHNAYLATWNQILNSRGKGYW